MAQFPKRAFIFQMILELAGGTQIQVDSVVALIKTTSTAPHPFYTDTHSNTERSHHCHA